MRNPVGEIPHSHQVKKDGSQDCGGKPSNAIRLLTIRAASAMKLDFLQILPGAISGWLVRSLDFCQLFIYLS
jgi:hypothetical protein